MIVVHLYLQIDGSCPFDEWFKKLDATVKVKVQKLIYRMELGNFGDVKRVGNGVYERRYNEGPGYRLYFGQDGDTQVLLLMGGTKRHQQADINKAKAYWADYLNRKGKEDAFNESI